MRVRAWGLAGLIAVGLLLGACDESGSGDADIDSDADTDTDADIDVDTDADADTDADSDTDTDTGAEPTTFPLATRSWILLDDSAEAVAEAIERAGARGVNEVQLSHDIIMNIDEINDEPERAERIRGYVQQAHAAGLTALVWAHEFNDVSLLVCFDPQDPIWEERASEYRRALQAVPEIDGVVLMFDSTDLPAWLAMCSCEYCEARKDEAADPDLPWQLQVPPGSERVQMLITAIHDVVVGELGKKLLARTFIHEPYQNEIMGQALSGVPELDFTAMSKDVPQDWEPFYPPHPLFGRLEPHDHVMEMDLAGEYWGQGVLPFCAVEYLERRFAYGASRNFDGYAARVSRGSNDVFGTPNEVNVFAAAAFSQSAAAVSEQVWDEFAEQRYGLARGTAGAKALIDALRSTFDIGRKMYYFKGFWALVKGSGLPGSLRQAKLLDGRSLHKWDPDYTAWYEELDEPTVQTLIDLRQEKREAAALSEAALSRLDDTGLGADDLADVRTRLQHQSLCVDTWTELAELVWGYRLWSRTQQAEVADWIEASLDAFEASADAVEAAGQGWPCDAASIRGLAADLRTSFPPREGTQPRDQLEIAPPDIEVAAGQATVRFTTDRPATTALEYGEEIPDYGTELTVSDEAATDHQVAVAGLEPGWHVLRVVATDPATGQRVNGGDFWFVVR